MRKGIILTAMLLGTVAMAAPRIVDGPDPVGMCAAKMPLMSDASTLDGMGMCSPLDYTNCVSVCIDSDLPWQITRYVSCSYTVYNRSYFMVSCECYRIPISDLNGGPCRPHAPSDVGMGY